MTEGLIVENIIKIDYVLAMITKGKELTPDLYEELRDLLDLSIIFYNFAFR